MLRSGVTEKVSTTEFKDISFDDKCTVIGGLRTELETLRVWQFSLTVTASPCPVCTYMYSAHS